MGGRAGIRVHHCRGWAVKRQPPGWPRLAESSAQGALGLLIHDGLAAVGPARPPLYQIPSDGQDDAVKILDVAARLRGGERLLASALRANPAVEFAALDDDGLLLVIRWDAEPAHEVRLGRMLRRTDLAVARFGHDEVRERLRHSASVRERANHSQLIAGSVDRSFPDQFKHGSPDAPPLGGLHPAVRRPSRSAMTRIARRFKLSEVRVFGSAVHADFRPDSDIDVMVRRKPGVRRTLEDELSLRRDLEDLWGRDVDVVDAAVLRGPFRERAESEGVVLYG